MKMNQLNKHYGVDVSEHNGIVNWQEVRDAGIEFAIIRLGYGRGHLDSQFYHNVNGALNAGISIGVYYYSYAQNCNDAIEEAAFATHILNDCGLVPARLTMGLWYDAEEAPLLGHTTNHQSLQCLHQYSLASRLRLCRGVRQF